MPTNCLLGYEGVIYLGDNAIVSPDAVGDINAVTWSEMDNVMDADGSFDSEKVDTTTRSEAKVGWASEIATTKSGTISFTARWKPEDTIFTQLLSAWLNGTEVSVLDLDGSYTETPPDTNEEGNQGLCANMTCSFSQKKPVKGIMTIDVTLTISSFPHWVAVNATGDALEIVT